MLEKMSDPVTVRVNKHRIHFFLASFLLLYAINLLVPMSFLGITGYTRRMWVLFQVLVICLSIYVLFRYGLPSRNKIMIAVILGGLSGIFNPVGGICTIITFTAASSIFREYNNEIKVFKATTPKQITTTVIIGVCIGVVLGLINLLPSNAQTVNLDIKPVYFLISLNPGIFEEVSFRLFMYAFCVHLFSGVIETREKQIWCYVLMVIPHVLIHLPDMFYANGVFTLDVISFVMSVLLLSLVFGLPFAVLQRKRDLSSAMIAHGIVDLIRFSFLGLPM